MNEISQEELRTRLIAGEPMSVLDIRETDEYNDWHICGSINVPLYNAIGAGRVDHVEHELGGLPFAKDKPVITVCRMGETSRVAVDILNSLGYQALSLTGGIRGWSNAWTEAPVALNHAVLIQVRRNGKGCLSYVFGSDGEAAVVDPCVDASVYRAIAEREGLTIKRVLETHVHADHISRAIPLSEMTGAPLYLPENDRVVFDYLPLEDGETFLVGRVHVTVISTPGHTQESVCYNLANEVLLSGDTIFTQNIGRPDLERGDAGAEAGAAMLYDSLHGRVLRLADAMVVCPGHTSDPIGFDAKPIASTLGTIKPEVDLLGLDRDAFIQVIPGLLGAKPPNFQRVISVNEGKAKLGFLDPLELEAGPNRCAVKR